VLFSDIRNFTTISERLEPGQVVEMLNAYFTEVCEVVRRNGGMVDKFIGDAVMAIFGAPMPCADHARQAVGTALEIRDVAKRFAESPTFRNGNLADLSFGIGIGLHRGAVVMGNIGSPGRMNYTATGDTVNVAARLEGLTKNMGCVILASDAVIVAAGSGLTLGKTCVAELKGRNTAVHVYEILGMNQQPEQDSCATSPASS
jgi:adenylate cyclase